MNPKDQLISLISEKSFRVGDFTLASGKKSKHYIDLKATTLHPLGAKLIGQLVVEAVQKKNLNFEAVGGLTLGADPIATAVSLAALEKGFEWPAYIVRKTSKEHGTEKYVEGTQNFSKGANVLVLEDTMTTGGSSLKAVERLRKEGYHPVAVLTIVDREEGGAEAVRAEGLEFLSLITIDEILTRYA